MKMIKATTDLKLTEHEFPSGTIDEQNRFLRELIGDEHGHPIMGNVLFVGEEWTSGGIGFCGIEESVFQELKAKLESVADTLSKARRCPRCGNMGIAPDQKFCCVRGLELKRKEKAPAARRSASGDFKKPQENDTPNGENCQTGEEEHEQKQN